MKPFAILPNILKYNQIYICIIQSIEVIKKITPKINFRTGITGLVSA
jgi:hypothetical protein